MMVVLEVVGGMLIATLGVVAILEPIVRAPVRQSDDADAEPALEAWEIEEDLSTPKARALAALKEIEFDRATGKLDDEDYGRLKNRYTRLAIEAIREEEAAAAAVAEPSDLEAQVEARIQEAAAALERGTGRCPDCGERPELEAKFCSNCGKPLAVALAS